MRWFGSRGSEARDAARAVAPPVAVAVAVDVARVAADAARARLYRLTECAPPALSAAWLNPPAPSKHQ